MTTAVEQRVWMKSLFSDSDAFTSDQKEGKPQPALTKANDDVAEIIVLPEFGQEIIQKKSILDLIGDRVSHRKYNDAHLSLQELSFLLWSTQGVKEVKGDNRLTKRTVPSAGARHPFETYLVVNRVDGLKAGVYRYLPISHELGYLFTPENMAEAVTRASIGQKYSGNSAVNFIWTAVPYRAEWRYNKLAAKPMLLDAGHICQNLYLACEAIGCGTCAIAAYDQEVFDQLLGLDGCDEFVVYLSPVGKV